MSCAAQVPIGELEGLGLELEKLSELESIREEWQLQAQAQDEVRNGARLWSAMSAVLLGQEARELLVRATTQGAHGCVSASRSVPGQLDAV